jgi:putative restriction endonuclease
VPITDGVADSEIETSIRAAMFAHLDRLTTAHPDGVPSSVINSFTFHGQPMKLIVQPGIWKPAGLSAALTIRTTYTPGDGHAPYEDTVGEDGNLRYKWRGTDPNHSDNRALREAMRRRLPLAYFYGVAKGVYQAVYPVFLVDEDMVHGEFAVELLDMPYTFDVGGNVAERRYASQLTMRRLHQMLFRPKVLRAYETRCAMCRLGHGPLLDAAHILPDRHERGDPIVPNGLALCKIHHAAFDANILGIRPDHRVEVREDVLREVDGPMLRHGLQEMHGTTISLPRSRADRPDPSRIEERYALFRAAAA